MRKDYVVSCVRAAVTLRRVACGANIDSALELLSAAISRAWTVEFRASKKCKEHAQILHAHFWDAVHTELASGNDFCSNCDFQAWFGPGINPPGQEGNVIIRFSGGNSIELMEFKVKLVEL